MLLYRGLHYFLGHMVYARYFKRRGKKYGPYYYTTERTKDGKVKSVYIGTKSPEKNYTTPSEKEIAPPISTSTWVKSAVLLALILILAVFALKYPAITGFITGQEAEGNIQQLNLTIEESQNYTWALESYPDNFYLQSIKLSGAITGDGDVKVYIEDEQGNRFLILNDGYAKETGQLSQITGRVVEQTETPVVEELQLEEQPPAEEPPAENITASVQENITEPSNITEGNITTPENTTQENQSEQGSDGSNETNVSFGVTIPENVTTPENITVENITINKYTFEDGCVDTCLLPTKEFNQTSYKLIFEISPNTTLELNSITYSYVSANITNATYAFEVDIKDAQNQSVPATVELVDSKTKEVKYSDEITAAEAEESKVKENKSKEQPPGLLKKSGAPETEKKKPIDLNVSEGNYDIKVEPQNHPIKEIEFKDIAIDENITEFVNIDDVPENSTNLSNVVEIYAIDPTAFAFTTATVTAVAAGDTLYKCKNWDFANQNCTDNNWTFMQAITPGEEYTFTLTPEDPAYLTTIQNMNMTNDSYVDQANSGTNYGTATTIYVQSRSSSRNMRTFEMFNVSDIPAQATIVSANLSLYKTGGTGSSTRTYNLYRVTASWTEASITWTNQPAVSGTLTDSISVATGTNNVWKTWDATSDVQNFVNGSYTNYGWRISDNSESSSTQYASNFASEEYTTDTSLRPKLDIYYTVPPTTPINITCDGGSCNNTFYNNVTLNCSGSTAGNEIITYVIDANYTATSTSAGAANVSTSCRTDTYTSGQTYEFYSKWTIPGSGNVTLTGFDFYDYDGTLSSSENIQMALYADGGSYNRLSEIVTIPGTGAVGWISKNLTTPITITLGNSYWIAVGPSGSPSYSLARDASADCSGYPPTGVGSYYQSASGGLDATVPTGASQSSNKYIIQE